MADDAKRTTSIAGGRFDDTPGWKRGLRTAWSIAKIAAAFVAAVWFARGPGAGAGVFAGFLAILIFLAAWVALSLLATAVCHPGVTACVLLVGLGGWLLLTGLEAMSVKALLAVIIVLLLFRS
jgi:hypothetical protein